MTKIVGLVQGKGEFWINKDRTLLLKWIEITIARCYEGIRISKLRLSFRVVQKSFFPPELPVNRSFINNECFLSTTYYQRSS